MLNIIRGIATYIFFLSLFYLIINKIIHFFIKIENVFIISIFLSIIIVFSTIRVNFKSES